MASAIGAQPDEIVFTSGGTESVSLAIWGAGQRRLDAGTRVVISSVEHHSVYGGCSGLAQEGLDVVLVPVDAYGRMDMDRYAAEVRVPGTVLASVQHANHELGTMQQVGGSVGTAVLSTIAASATASYAQAHLGASSSVSETHGYTVVFLTSALIFAAGGVLAAVFFPSKARLAEMRASVVVPDAAVRRLEAEMLDEFGALG